MGRLASLKERGCVTRSEGRLEYWLREGLCLVKLLASLEQVYSRLICKSMGFEWHLPCRQTLKLLHPSVQDDQGEGERLETNPPVNRKSRDTQWLPDAQIDKLCRSHLQHIFFSSIRLNWGLKLRCYCVFFKLEFACDTKGTLRQMGLRP